MNDIFEAIRDNDQARLVALLRNGADPNQIKSEWIQLRPLHAAIVALGDGGSLEQVKLLLRYGADINGTYPDTGGGTPLLVALNNGQFEAATFYSLPELIQPLEA